MPSRTYAHCDKEIHLGNIQNLKYIQGEQYSIYRLLFVTNITSRTTVNSSIIRTIRNIFTLF